MVQPGSGNRYGRLKISGKKALFLSNKSSYFCLPKNFRDTEALAQLVRASDCGSEGRGFETHMPP